MSDKTVLLVEDNDDDVELTLRSFKKQNINSKVVVARNGQEALDYLFAKGTHAKRDASQSPDVVFLDIKLPKIDGLEVLRQIRAEESTRLIPVVVLTTSTEAHDKISSYQLGANSYVRKPVDFDKFQAATRQLGEYWLLLNEVAAAVSK